MNDETAADSLYRRDFLAFAQKAIIELDGTKVAANSYVEYLATNLVSIAAGKTRRLLINIPPRHLKTQLASVCLSAWILAHDPRAKILIVTYTESLAKHIARAIRSILQAHWFKKRFDTRIKRGHAEILKFATTAGGEVYAASMDGSITGFGADCIIVDDPHNIADAGNVKRLKRTIDKFHTEVMSRLNNRKRGKVIVIAHRIHHEDLSANLLATGRWTHVVLPLIAPCDVTYETAYGEWRRRKGTVLRPDAFDPEEVDQWRGGIVNPSFDMLYQQDVDGKALPSITEDNFRFFVKSSRGLPHILSIDPGSGESDRGSFSVIQVWAFDGHAHMLVEQFRERCDFNELSKASRILARRYRARTILIERAANGPALISEFARKKRWRVRGVNACESKAARLRPHIDKIINGKVQLLSGAPFCSAFVQEFVAFPHCRHTDQVDACTQYLAYIEEHSPFDQPHSPERQHVVVSCNSQISRGHLSRFRQDPQAPGLIAMAGYSQLMPNGPLPTVRAWIKY